MERIIMPAPQAIDEIRFDPQGDGTHCVMVSLRFNDKEVCQFPVYFAKACEDDERSAGDPRSNE